MSNIIDRLRKIAADHQRRMRDDPLYRITFEVMRQATKSTEPSRHYDRDGYCDNPARGY